MDSVKNSLAEEEEPSYLVPLNPNKNFIKSAGNIQKRFSFLLNDEENDTIAVYLRIKPSDPSTKTEYLSYDESGNHITLKKKGVCKDYKFTHIFKPTASQPEVFKTCALPCVKRLFQGQDSFIFTYGVSNSGKTFTVQGMKSNPGLIPRTLVTVLSSLQDCLESNSILCPLQGTPVVHLSQLDQEDVLFHKKLMLSLAESAIPLLAKSETFIPLSELKQLSEGIHKLQVNDDKGPCNYSLWLSFYEIYNEKVYDLFDKPRDKRIPLRIITNKDGSVYVKDLNHIQVSTLEEALLLYSYARSDLCVGATCANENSSRSHSIFTMKLIAHPPHVADSYFFCSSLSICDLAGTERVCRTRNTGLRLREAQSINKSFLVLNRCISIIRDNQDAPVKNMVPYRESKLTQVLGPSFTSGQSKLAMIVTLTLDKQVIEETEYCLTSSSVATFIRTLPAYPIPRNETRFNLAIGKCQPGQTYDWKAMIYGENSSLQDRHKGSNSCTENSNQFGDLKEMYPVGCEPDVYKELEEERKMRLKAEARKNELQELINDLRGETQLEYDRKIKALMKENNELEEECTEYRVEILRLKKFLRLANEEKQEIKERLEAANQNGLELLEQAQQEVIKLKEIIKEKDEIIIGQEKHIQSLQVDKHFLEDTILLNEGIVENPTESEDDDNESRTTSPKPNGDCGVAHQILQTLPPYSLRTRGRSKNNQKNYDGYLEEHDENLPPYSLRRRSPNVHADLSTTVKMENKDCSTDIEDMDSNNSYFLPPRPKTTGKKKKKANKCVNNNTSSSVSSQPSTGSRRKLFLRPSGILEDNLDCTRNQDVTICSPETILKKAIKATKRF